MDYFKAEKAIKTYDDKVALGKKPTANQLAKYEAAQAYLAQRRAEKEAECGLFQKYGRG